MRHFENPENNLTRDNDNDDDVAECRILIYQFSRQKRRARQQPIRDQGRRPFTILGSSYIFQIRTRVLVQSMQADVKKQLSTVSS